MPFQRVRCLQAPVVLIRKEQQLGGDVATLQCSECRQPLRLHHAVVTSPLDHQSGGLPVLHEALGVPLVILRLLFGFCFVTLAPRYTKLPFRKPELLWERQYDIYQNEDV